MIQNLAQISGAYPIIRAGGSTQNRAVYVANQTEALNQTFSNPGDDQPSALTIGPKWFESFQQFPKGTQYIYGLNFFDGEDGLDQTVLQAAAAFKAVGEDIYAFEIGNEVDGQWQGKLNLDKDRNLTLLQGGQEAQDDPPTGLSRLTSTNGVSTLRQ